MRISDWSSDVCSSDLHHDLRERLHSLEAGVPHRKPATRLALFTAHLRLAALSHPDPSVSSCRAHGGPCDPDHGTFRPDSAPERSGPRAAPGRLSTAPAFPPLPAPGTSLI